ncbi:hypothetical protein F4678DRAFT_460037 [Xylaria arbuscula]|nr:hypothetical protein F4678DRAFT_460037 [Xylaria arbuscula]
MPVDGAARDNTQKSRSFGYYAVWGLASVDYNVLLIASNTSLSNEDRKCALLKVIGTIQAATATSVVDKPYVSKRLVLATYASDPRLLGLNFDPRSKKNIIFN